MQNILTYFPYSKKYYLLRPWRFIAQCCRNIRWSFQRARRGWCDMDSDNMCDWFLIVIPEMLEALSHGHGWPERPEYNNIEDWHKDLRMLAADLRSCTDEAQNIRNEYYPAYCDGIDKTTYILNKATHTLESHEPPGFDEIAQSYYARAREIANESQTVLQGCLLELAKLLPALWD